VGLGGFMGAAAAVALGLTHSGPSLSVSFLCAAIFSAGALMGEALGTVKSWHDAARYSAYVQYIGDHVLEAHIRESRRG
jgi:hypothetical protein